LLLKSVIYGSFLGYLCKIYEIKNTKLLSNHYKNNLKILGVGLEDFRAAGLKMWMYKAVWKWD